MGIISVKLLLAFILLITVPFSESLEEGDLCDYNADTKGECKLVYLCARAIEDYKMDKKPVICKDGLIQVVCCPTENTTTAGNQTTDQTPTKRLAEQKCLEYSEFVYENKTDSTGTITRVDKCAVKKENLISGGKRAKPRAFPHMARIGFGCTNSTIVWYCEGSVISRRYILTVVHCTKAKNIKVRVGDLVWNQDDDDSRPQTIEVESALIHPLNTHHQYNDIAMLKLVHDIEFNAHVRPACINTDAELIEERAISSGWKRSDWFDESSRPLLVETLDRLPITTCTAKYAETFVLSYGLVEKEQLCYGFTSPRTIKCFGDSGGPLQVYHDTYCMYKIVGVSSFGRVCGVCGYPDIFTRVSNYVDWIEENAFSHG